MLKFAPESELKMLKNDEIDIGIAENCTWNLLKNTDIVVRIS